MSKFYFVNKINREDKHHPMRLFMKVWDKKLYRLDDEMLTYIMQRADTIITNRRKNIQERHDDVQARR